MTSHRRAITTISRTMAAPYPCSRDRPITLTRICLRIERGIDGGLGRRIECRLSGHLRGPPILGQVESAGLEPPARHLADQVVGRAETLTELAHERGEEGQTGLRVLLYHRRERVPVEDEQLGVDLGLHAGR